MNYDLLFIFILNYRNYVRQKANSSDFFLFKFKMSCKVAETTHNIINTSGPGAASKCSVAVIEEVGIHGTLLQFKKFCEGDKSPENEEHNCQPAEVDNNQLRAITEADPLKTT